MRTRRSGRSRTTLIAASVIGGITGGLAVLWLAEGSWSACLQAFDDRNPPWSMMSMPSEGYCISLVNPSVAESSTLELTDPPRLLSDPDDAVRRLESLASGLGPSVSGVATVRFQATDQGAVSDPRVIESSGHEALDEAIAAIATSFEFSPGTTASGPVEVPMEYVVGFQADTRGRLFRWLSAIGT